MFFSQLKRGFTVLLDPLVTYFIRRGLHPDTFTILGLVFNSCAGVLYGFGLFFEGGLVMLFGSITDLVDGQMARRRDEVSIGGALLDSALDRYSEIVVLTGLLVHYSIIGWKVSVVAAALTISGSLMVSYVRARGEGLNIECRVGFMQRPERIIFLSAASVFGFFLGSPDATVAATLWVMGAATHFTTIERVAYIRRVARRLDAAARQVGEAPQPDTVAARGILKDR